MNSNIVIFNYKHEATEDVSLQRSQSHNDHADRHRQTSALVAELEHQSGHAAGSLESNLTSVINSPTTAWPQSWGQCNIELLPEIPQRKHAFRI